MARLLAPLPWLRLIVASGARVVLVAIVALGLWGAVPAVLGWHPTTVMSGSMQPRLRIGDIAVARPTVVADLRLGQVLLFDDPDHPGRLRLHRFVAVADDGRMITRGDANPTEDSSHVDPSAVRGVAVLRVPLVALPVVWMHDGRLLRTLLAGLVVIGLMALAMIDRDLRRDDGDSAPGGRGGGPPRRAHQGAVPDRQVVRGRGVASRALLVGLLAVVCGRHRETALPAWATWSAQTSQPASTLTAARYYSCTSTPVFDAPTLFWRLDEAGGTAVDSSATGTWPGTYVGGSTTGSACGTGAARTFNGTTSQYVHLAGGAFTPSAAFSVEVWVRSTVGGRIVALGSQQSGNNVLGVTYRGLFMNGSGAISFTVSTGLVNASIVTTATYGDGQWHHVVGTLSSAGMVLYVDGTQRATGANSAVVGTAGYWRLGADGVGLTPVSLNGGLDNFAVYPRALTADQVAGHYASRS